jgi:hypothetical protein
VRALGTVKYIAGSRYAHDRKSILRKVEELSPLLGALIDKKVSLIRELFLVVVANTETDRALIIAVEDSYEDAYEEAQMIFSAMHELEVEFDWKIRIDRIALRAE